MIFKKYIIENYEKEFSEPAPKNLVSVLNNICANKFTVNEFAAHFNLDTTLPLTIIEFVMNPNNSYEIGKFGNRKYNEQEDALAKMFSSDRKKTASDEHYDYGEGKFTKKF